MRIAILRKSGLPVAPIKREVKRAGLLIDQKHPDVILSMGGDGTLLEAERKWPGVPKVMVRESWICHKCEDLTFDEILGNLKKGAYRIESLSKIELQMKVDGKTIKKLALNEVSMRNKLMTRALRFAVTVNDKETHETVIADGAVIATPFGSTGYFYSVSKKSIDKRFGIAFNNATILLEPVLLDEKSQVIITLLRHDAHIATDNDPKILTLKPGQSMTIKKAKEQAKLVRFRS